LLLLLLLLLLLAGPAAQCMRLGQGQGVVHAGWASRSTM
jgi:hypothetical protein